MSKKQIKTQQENMKLKKEINKARSESYQAMQFLVDIGTKKHRAKYQGSNKDLSQNKAQIMDTILREITTAILLRHVCKKKKKIFNEADALMKELFQ